MTELKVYGHLQGTAEQRFIEPNGHPQFKLLANSAVLIGAVAGVANAILKTIGEIEINYPAGNPNYTTPRTPIIVPGPATPIPPLPVTTNAYLATTQLALNATRSTFNAGLDLYFSLGGPYFLLLKELTLLQNYYTK